MMRGEISQASALLLAGAIAGELRKGAWDRIEFVCCRCDADVQVVLASEYEPHFAALWAVLSMLGISVYCCGREADERTQAIALRELALTMTSRQTALLDKVLTGESLAILQRITGRGSE